MIEEGLANYGVLGLWTLSMLTERYVFQKNLSKALKNMTDEFKELKLEIRALVRCKK